MAALFGRLPKETEHRPAVWWPRKKTYREIALQPAVFVPHACVAHDPCQQSLAHL